MSASEPVNVRVLDREYTVGVEADGRDALMSAARLLDTRMREVRGANRMAAVDRVAVLAALNLAHELEQLRNEQGRRERELARALGELQRRLDAAADVG
ncbi:cell division protein ZapA [Luteimonas sp. SJ-92]|uniref:Cell division protein ZapA n=1 Tax=Luteimonas salinisoli TaxID=2752307 RepID=A0A853JI17_9GAMM|nr:cell division protein ZapA [Luteimonas salinisoli]